MGFCCHIYRDTFLVIKGPCTTVINIELGDRLTVHVEVKSWREGGALTSLVQVCVVEFLKSDTV